MAFTIRNMPSKDSIQAFADRFSEADPKAIDLTLRLLICSAELEEMMNLHFNQHGLSRARFSAENRARERPCWLKCRFIISSSSAEQMSNLNVRSIAFGSASEKRSAKA